MNSAKRRVAYSPDAFPPGGPSQQMAGLFPDALFEALPRPWSGSFDGADIVIATADAADPQGVDQVCAHLAACGGAERVLVFLDAPTTEATRRLVRAGAGDVLPAPISEPALAGSLERLFGRLTFKGPEPETDCRVIAVLKAGGGVGATTVATQLAAILAERRDKVCLVDLDLQSGSAAVYLDVANTITMDSVLAAGGALGETTFANSLAAHSSGARVLAAPAHFMPLDALTPGLIDTLLAALRREFDVVLLDLPTDWTDWSYRAVRQADEILLITQLSVPHAHLVRRQLEVLSIQGLAGAPLRLVCNRVGRDMAPGVSVKAIERALGRSFQAELPDDGKLVAEAINQGLALSSVRRGTKLEKALHLLADQLRPPQAEAPRARRWGR
jgi:pilus assembly protein CpaE